MNSKKRLLLMLPFLLVAGWLALFGDKNPAGGGSSGVAEPVVHARAPQPEPPVGSDDVAITGQRDSSQVIPMSDRSVLAKLEDEKKVDLFPGAAADVPVAASAPAEAEAPPPPVQPFRWIGRMFDRDHWVAFLEKGDKTYAVKVGDVVEGFRFAAVNDNEIRLTQLADRSNYVIPMSSDKKESTHD